jgi:hypothetical protein
MEDKHRSLYIVNQDLAHCWGDCVLPPKVTADALRDIRAALFAGLRRIVAPTELITIRESLFCANIEGMLETAKGSEDRCVVGLSPFCHRPDAELEVTRIAVRDGDRWKKALDMVARPKTPSLPAQLELIRTRAAGRPIVLVDDGIWSSGTILEIIRMLSAQGLEVESVVVGIVTDYGKIRNQGLPPIFCVFRFPDANVQVVEWICEHDFFVGTPGFGRTLGAPDSSQADPRGIGIPYSLPNGDPEAWASIPPPVQREFSELCLRVSLALFEEIGRNTGAPVLVGDLKTVPYGLEDSLDRPFCECLKEWIWAL